ncbi:hypothetical protein COO60DRAFT_262353 [Scenedesmus sp. NREL 46B-D3]|nr:hypothetical protein COO60DRAFT_262353 [Scenedesmus sp. NREL 46B-D3]
MFSFLNEIAAPTADTKDKDLKAGEEDGPDEAAGKTDAAAGIGLGLGSFWNVATAVTSAVKQSANEVVKSVQHTDWSQSSLPSLKKWRPRHTRRLKLCSTCRSILPTRLNSSSSKAHASRASQRGAPRHKQMATAGVVVPLPVLLLLLLLLAPRWRPSVSPWWSLASSSSAAQRK